MTFSTKSKLIEKSRTTRLASLIQSLKEEGRDIIGLHVGEPDFDTPTSIKEATITAIKENKTKYGLVSGELELRKKIASRFDYELTEKNILVANGSKQIIFTIFQSLCNPEDEVIVFRPYWVTFPESIKLAGGIPVFVETKKDYHLDFENIKNAITSKTKAILINTPNNPTGAVYKEADLIKLSKLAIEKDITLIVDEAYDRLIYGDNKHFSVGLSSKESFENTITIKTFSKTFCMTGFRIGYMIASEKYIEVVNTIQSHLSGNNCTFVQYGALEALNIEQQVVSEMVSTYQKRADLAYKYFTQIFNCKRPEGAFYLFCDIRKYLGDQFKNDEDFALYILEKANVALVPGVAFGQPGFIRLSFSENEKNIERAFKRLEAIL
jgi:aspartate aminotransferase